MHVWLGIYGAQEFTEIVGGAFVPATPARPSMAPQHLSAYSSRHPSTRDRRMMHHRAQHTTRELSILHQYRHLIDMTLQFIFQEV